MKNHKLIIGAKGHELGAKLGAKLRLNKHLSEARRREGGAKGGAKARKANFSFLQFRFLSQGIDNPKKRREGRHEPCSLFFFLGAIVLTPQLFLLQLKISIPPRRRTVLRG